MYFTPLMHVYTQKSREGTTYDNSSVHDQLLGVEYSSTGQCLSTCPSFSPLLIPPRFKRKAINE